MTIKTQIFDASEIDMTRHVAALNRAFHSSAWAGEIGAMFTETFYSWKYNTPAGQAKIAYVTSGGELVSGVSAAPVMLDVPGQGPSRGWQVGDIMTAPDMRRRGYCGKCLSALVESMSDQLLICFPNERSRRAIERAGFAAVADVHTFARPLLPISAGKRLHSGDLSLDRISGPETTTASQWLGVRRNPDYLQWRYARHPLFTYRAVGGAEGFAVIRGFNLFGKNVAIVMEFHPAIGSARRLLREVHRCAKENGMAASFLMASWFPLRPVSSGYVFIPPSLMPKRQVLFVRYPGGRKCRLPWRSQIGDWDGL